MIDLQTSALGISTGCVIVMGAIKIVQARVENEIALGQEFIAVKRALTPVKTDHDLQREIRALKAQIAEIDASRTDLFNYLLKLENTIRNARSFDRTR